MAETVAFDAGLEPLLREIGGAASALGVSAYAVGGVVRDAFRGRRNTDVDVAVEGDPAALVNALAKRWQARATRHGAFGTATLETGAWSVDVVTARRETYPHPGALPVVVPAAIDDDLRRRDFTVNAMAARLSPNAFGALVDPLGGREDLRHNILRVLHAGSFRDDPTRHFRAARYAVRYALTPDAATDGAARAAVENGALATVSADRLRREIEIACGEPLWAEALAWLNGWGVWRALGACDGVSIAFLSRAAVTLAWAERHGVEAPDAPTFRWYVFLAGVPDGTAETLNARPADRRVVERAGSVITALDGPNTPDWARAMDAEPLDVLLLALTMARTDGDKGRLTHYLTGVRPLRPCITGSDLLALGARPGPAVGAALRATLDAVRDGTVRGRAAELAYAWTHYQQHAARAAGSNTC